MNLVFWVLILIMLIYLCVDGYRTRTVEFWRMLTLLALIFVGLLAVGKPV